MVETTQVEWRQHATGDQPCERCASGFPHPCPCGGRVHGEVLNLPDGGFIQLTRCERCEKSAD